MAQHISISVIIPTYNRAAFIATAIESALSQTRRPDEILVVDDGSTDGTDCILSEFGPPVRVIRQPNRGRSAARNTGLRAATGDAVVFLDSDDLLMPDCVAFCAEALESHHEVGVVYSDAMLVDAERNLLCLHSEAMPGPRPSGMVLGELARRNFLTITTMVRRSCLGETPFQDGMEYAEDYDLWRRLASRYEFLYVDKPLTCYRVHDAMSVCAQFTESLAGQVEVQRRIIEMPEFQQLPRGEQSRAVCGYGVKRAMLGETSVPRSYFWRAIRTSPAYPAGYLLLLLSLCGNRALQFAILQRRRLAGNLLGAESGPIDLVKKRGTQLGAAANGAGAASANLPRHSAQRESTGDNSKQVCTSTDRQQELVCSKF
jgi:glycosyltransferase involved in cell wall biosynthesis